MRLALAAALVAAVAAAPSAQTQFADSAGVYVGVHEISARAFETSVGYRQANGLDYGVRFGGALLTPSGGRAGTAAAYTVGPEVGYTRALGAGVAGRVSATALYGSSGATFEFRPASAEPSFESYSARTLIGNLTATVSRPVRVYGSFRVRPTLGVYAETRQVLSYERSPSDVVPGDLTYGGVHLGLPLSVRLFKRDVTVSPFAQLPVVGAPGYTGLAGAYSGGGLRVNF